MFDEMHYVPVLKGRAGEYGALAETSSRVRGAVTPLIEIPTVPWDFEADEPAKTVQAHVQPVAQSLQRAWGTDRRLFVDAGLLPPDELIDGRHPLAFILDAARDLTLLVVPVWGPQRSEPYIEAVRDAVATDNRGVCLRIEPDDFDDLEEPDELREQLIEATRTLRCAVQETDLVMDLGAVSADQRWTGATVRLLLGEVPTPAEWRSLTLVAGAFPIDLSAFQGNSIGSTPRAEWQLWRGLYNRRERLARMPTFGDYGISHPAPREVDPRLIQRSASIRYTTEEDYLVLKGRSVRREGAEQQHDLAAALRRRPEYHGEDFSAGDAYIAACARREVGPGNAATWRRVGTSQHLAFVTAQIASLTDA